MRPEIRWLAVAAAAAALALGAGAAESYARLSAPYDAAVARLITRGHPWTIVDVAVAPGKKSPGAVLRLRAEVRRAREDLKPAALVIARLQVGAAVETPLVFWTALLLWPAESWEQRLRLLALGIPMFFALVSVTTVAQLVTELSATSAILAGDPDPLTLWERWSRFLEAGGRFVLELCTALVVVALASQARRADPVVALHPAMRRRPRHTL